MAEAARAGAPPEVLAAIQNELETAVADIEIAPDEADAVNLFLALGTQWRTGFAGVTGFDYAAIRPTAELMKIVLTPDLFADLRVMEQETLNTWAERRK